MIWSRNFVVDNRVLIILAVGGSLVPVVTRNQYVLHLLILSYILGVLAASWDLMAGYTGLLSFGHQASYALGAYASAISVMYLGISPWLGLLIGGIFPSIIVLIIAYPILKTLRGTYIALMTLAFSLVVYEVIILLRSITGGLSGLWGIPSFPSIKLGALTIVFSYQDRTSYYYLALVMTIAVILLLRTFVNSRYGIFLRIIKESDAVGESIGLDTVRLKLLSLTTATFIAGVIGAFYAHYTQIITPDMGWIQTMLDILLATMLGGMGTIYGGIAGALAVTFLKEYLRIIGDLRLVLYGVILIVITIFFPGGLLKRMSNLW